MNLNQQHRSAVATSRGGRPRRRSAQLALGGLALLTVTAFSAGCSVRDAAYPVETQRVDTSTATGDDAAGPGRTATPPSAGSGSASEPEVSRSELREDMDDAVAATDQFWANHWTEHFTGSYLAPSVVGLYDGSQPDTAPTCDGVPLEADNAFYCEAGDYVAWDQHLIDRGTRIGDAWVYLVVAHEWGHAIQARLDPSLVTDDDELQADCFAGAALVGAAQDGTLVFESGDTKEIVAGLNDIADETPWTNSGDHGDTFERVAAFDLGRTSGVDACLQA